MKLLVLVLAPLVLTSPAAAAPRLRVPHDRRHPPAVHGMGTDSRRAHPRRRPHRPASRRTIGGSLITVTIAPRPGVVLLAGALRRPAANHAFRVRADALCAMASRRLAALPPFPFPGFDPLHPDPQLLPQVGRFFTGPHDPRPILHALEASLQVLGQPPADRRGWARVIAARAAALKVNDEQDRAALSGYPGAFVRSVHDAQRSFRAVAIGTDHLTSRVSRTDPGKSARFVRAMRVEQPPGRVKAYPGAAPAHAIGRWGRRL